eukprot:6534217-Prorocentrum_lima.AAC.1
MAFEDTEQCELSTWSQPRRRFRRGSLTLTTGVARLAVKSPSRSRTRRALIPTLSLIHISEPTRLDVI